MRLLATLTLALVGQHAPAMAQPASMRADPALESRNPWRGLLPDALAAGRARLTVWGFDIYDASLWVAPGFRQAGFERHAFVLELGYLRAFSAQDIAARSLAEMQRAQPLEPGLARRWQSALEALLPDVARGDTITGVHRPGAGAAFLVNGRPAGEIADPEFARLFFGIWLDPRTSEPGLRQRLLAGTAP